MLSNDAGFPTFSKMKFSVAVNYKTYKTIRLFYKTDFEAKIILLKESYSLLPIL